ncbi:MAG: hypothetical protein V4713_09790 [Pseudomonadota bacterium]
MKNLEFKTPAQSALEEMSAALFELRDALTDLSLTLKDYQFETDQEKRQSIEKAVDALLHELSLSRPSSE